MSIGKHTVMTECVRLAVSDVQALGAKSLMPGGGWATPRNLVPGCGQGSFGGS